MNARAQDTGSRSYGLNIEAPAPPIRIALVSLGCPKNLVDSEEMLGALSNYGFHIIPDCAEAEVIIVNTCGFIGSAKEESIDAILQAAQFKRTGACQSLIVAGCLAQRYVEELRHNLPEVDAFVGIGQYGDLPGIIRKTLTRERQSSHAKRCETSGCGMAGFAFDGQDGSNRGALVHVGKPPEKWIENAGRLRSTPPWTAYLKISDGCDNRCAYCAIPEIRGRYRSRPPDLVLQEGERLAGQGVKELILIGQDITLYGEDLGGGWSLDRLLGELVRLDIHWLRLMYCYPTRVTDALIQRIASEPKVCSYMDLPMQHGDDAVLERMGRRGRSRDYLALIKRLREACPDIALRSSFIVGFPGETEEEYENLLRFVETARFDRAGAFRYSREEGTRAAAMSGQVSRRTVEKRYGRLMEIQERISLERNKELIGRRIDVLVESTSVLSGRSYRDAPEIDGVIYLEPPAHAGPFEGCCPGQIASAVITEAREHDLVANLVIGRNIT